MSTSTKTAAFTALVVVSNVAGNSLLNWGEKSEQWLIAIAGVALLIVWMLARMALLSWADLSWVLPVTSIGYVLSALSGQVFFDEPVTTGRWVGVALITAGAALVGAQDNHA